MYSLFLFSRTVLPNIPHAQVRMPSVGEAEAFVGMARCMTIVIDDLEIPVSWTLLSGNFPVQGESNTLQSTGEEEKWTGGYCFHLGRENCQTGAPRK